MVYLTQNKSNIIYYKMWDIDGVVMINMPIKTELRKWQEKKTVKHNQWYYFIINVSYNGPAWYLTYNDIVMKAKLQLERPMSKDPVMPESNKNHVQS